MFWHNIFNQRATQSNAKTNNQISPSGPETPPSVSELKVDEQGRMRATNVPYILPKDLQEVHRLDFQHYLCRFIIKGNYLAPVENPQTILDVGCGTGRWQYEIALEFPQAQLVGVDIVNPTAIARDMKFPTNNRFVVANILDGLPFPANSFDFVHQRLLVASIPAKQWPFVIQELIRVTRPGGWIELVENNIPSSNMGPNTERFMGWITTMFTQLGLDPAVAQKIGTLLQNAGLSQVTVQSFPGPIGEWAGPLGRMASTNIRALAEAVKDPVLKIAGVTPEKYQQVVDKSLKEAEEYYTYNTLYFAYAQKPVP